jgi:AcrR family transcriptional regulator
MARTALKAARPGAGQDARARILQAGLSVFAAHGFEGATMQEIAELAEVKLPLIVYHFKSKRNLWEAVAEERAARIVARSAEAEALTEGSATERLRRLIAIWVELGAENPEYHRMLTLEGHKDNDRLSWIHQRHLRQNFEFFSALFKEARAEGGVRDLAPELLRYAVIGLVSIPATSAEFKLLTGQDAADPSLVRRTIETIEQLIFVDPRPPGA